MRRALEQPREARAQHPDQGARPEERVERRHDPGHERGAAPADVSAACLRSLDAHATTERLGALDDFAVYSASGVIDRADADELLRLAEDQWTASAAAGDATSNYRTSETASLRDDASRASKAVDRVAARAAALFGLPRSGSRVVPVAAPTGTCRHWPVGGFDHRPTQGWLA